LKLEFEQLICCYSSRATQFPRPSAGRLEAVGTPGGFF
jgi:hypothetical protein